MSKILDLLIPARCASCGVPGAPCCATCQAVWGSLSEITRGPTAGLVPVYALARYADEARRLILAYKERGRRDLAPSLGRAVADVLEQLPGEPRGPCLVPVPSRRHASRVRGGPHVQRVAEECAKVHVSKGKPVTVSPVLKLGAGVRDAVGLTRVERAANLAGRIRLLRGDCPKEVVLLDDVITTGATVAACARLLGVNGIHVSAVIALAAAG
ncbi:amidophosphoribosyltransferase [Amycolatopsis sp. WAC 01375]|uniref:ComF family protein n=1 Tax=unclassified Amycolatopsis TaxID=2618356 RepID=UPI000F790F5E|nr:MULTISPECIES: ComF family protein [unclassified Amycolatopsis]RSM71912.1 amidophosphoribosyltransferase [Amycolatopsis sp. WAC 01375]RSN32005.1 amidophosphoribosyltransferase [Amycolatopsis sp. WAC 01416]